MFESRREDLIDTNDNKVLGKFKDEMHSLPLREWIGLNPKVYSFIGRGFDDKTKEIYYDKERYWKNKKTLKGVSKAVVKNNIEHKDYVDVISTDCVAVRDVVSIRSFNHQLYTFKQPKIALTSFYDKMCMINRNDCVPFGYVKVNNN